MKNWPYAVCSPHGGRVRVHQLRHAKFTKLGPDFIQTIRKSFTVGVRVSEQLFNLKRWYRSKSFPIRMVHHILLSPPSRMWRSRTRLERNRTRDRTWLNWIRPPAVCIAAGSLPENFFFKKNDFNFFSFFGRNWNSFDGQMEKIGADGLWRDLEIAKGLWAYLGNFSRIRTWVE
jgi:hypothetical protein